MSVAGEIVGDSFAEVFASLLKEDIIYETLVDTLTRVGFALVEDAVHMSASPVINRSSVPVGINDLGGLHDKMMVRQIVIVAVGVDEGRPRSKKGDILGPNVFEGANTKKVACADESFVGVSPIVERDQHIDEFMAEIVPHCFRKDEEEGGVREERDDEGVDIDDAVVDT